MHEAIHQPADDDPRHQVVARITECVQSGDHAQLAEIAAGQDLLGPLELIEYMDVKYRHSTDPDEQNQWRGALSDYLGSLEAQEFSEGEARTIDTLTRSLRFGDMMSAADFSENPDVTDLEVTEAVAHNWEASEFHVRLEPEVIAKLQALPIFKSAQKLAQMRDLSFPLKVARELIIDNTEGSLQRDLLILFDLTVFEQITDLAKREQFLAQWASHAISAAQSNADSYASSEATALEMKLTLDKYLFRHAKSVIANNEFYASLKAREMIEWHASTPARRDAILEQFDAWLKQRNSQ